MFAGSVYYRHHYCCSCVFAGTVQLSSSLLLQLCACLHCSVIVIIIVAAVCLQARSVIVIIIVVALCLQALFNYRHYYCCSCVFAGTVQLSSLLLLSLCVCRQCLLSSSLLLSLCVCRQCLLSSSLLLSLCVCRQCLLSSSLLLSLCVCRQWLLLSSLLF